jgi:succinate dehydrogenase/fumarate reductase flavoprotein subunit
MYLALKNLIADRSIPVHYETPVKELIQDPTSREVVGVVAEEQGNKIYVKAKKGVVLACGGYESNPEMMSYFKYPGGSNIPEAMAFGRIAGENAAAENP